MSKASAFRTSKNFILHRPSAFWMTALFGNGSSVCPILGLLAVVGHSPELAGQFVMSLLHQRNGMLRWPASSIVTIVILYLNSQRCVLYNKYHGKREYQESFMFRILFTHLRHIHRWNGSELNWAGYIKENISVFNNFYGGWSLFSFLRFLLLLFPNSPPPTLLIIRDC